MINGKRKIIITGAAGLVGQNLLDLLSKQEDLELIAIDKHKHNMDILRSLYPKVIAKDADLAISSNWENLFKEVDVAVFLHAQITGKTIKPFVRNNLEATQLVLKQCHVYNVPYIVHVSSSVVNSVANDDYTNTKREQEYMIRESGIKHCILRPTLMFGWFDPKHLGWLARFMEKAPIFPIPGHGRYARQPLYNRDFCRAIEFCIDKQPENEAYDLVGPEYVDYIDIIRTIKDVKGLKTPIIKVPYHLFALLLKIYAIFSSKPPFTADQLKALTAGDMFTGVNIKEVFGFTPTPFEEAIRETFLDPKYSKIALEGYI